VFVPRGITPEDIKGANFSVALRGYDRGEVESFLQDVAAEVSALKDSSARAYQNVGEDLGGLLQQAKDVADKLLSEASSEAAALVQSAENEASRMREDADAHARQVRGEADGDAASTRAEAEQDAARLIDAASTRVRELGAAEAEARQRISALRDELARVADSLRHLGGDDSRDAGIDQEEDLVDDQARVDTSEVQAQEPAR
jgi:DivIVA domain-containing protein